MTYFATLLMCFRLVFFTTKTTRKGPSRHLGFHPQPGGSDDQPGTPQRGTAVLPELSAGDGSHPGTGASKHFGGGQQSGSGARAESATAKYEI